MHFFFLETNSCPVGITAFCKFCLHQALPFLLLFRPSYHIVHLCVFLCFVDLWRQKHRVGKDFMLSCSSSFCPMAKAALSVILHEHLLNLFFKAYSRVYCNGRFSLPGISEESILLSNRGVVAS